MSASMKTSNVKKLVKAFRDGLDEEEDAEKWDSDTERVVEVVYGGLLLCVDDELYAQEFLPFGSIYKITGERSVRLRKRNVPIEKVMEEHILLRDVFWELRRSRPEKVHDFTVEKRICQCFNSLLQATVHAYKTREPTMDVLDPLRDQATGVFNSMYFMTRLEEEIKRSERYMRDVSVALFEIRSDFMDDSPEETELMRAVARVLRRNSRGSDILARVEREKFGMLLSETRASDAVLATERLKSQVTEYLAGIGSKYKDVSVGMGLASYPEHGEERDVLLQEATESIMREVAEGE